MCKIYYCNNRALIKKIYFKIFNAKIIKKMFYACSRGEYDDMDWMEFIYLLLDIIVD